MDQRPFLDFWDHLWSLELQRQQGAFGGKGIDMIKTFVADIGTVPFLQQAKRTYAVQEIARFYENTLDEAKDIEKLYVQMDQNHYHQEAFVYAIYFAAWIKSEVHGSKQLFKKYDEELVRIVD